jgi:VWFA-related protein
MKKLLTAGVTFVLLFSITMAQTPQTPQNPQNPPQEIAPEDVVRISTTLVQTDVVVTDKNDQIVTDLTADDFKITENGKRQEVKFAQFVSAEASPRLDGNLTVAGKPVDPEVARNLAARDLRRVFAFVVDDLTIPYEDVGSVREMLTDFVDNKMREGDLVAIVRVVGGGGLLQQFTTDKRILRRAISRISPNTHPFGAFHDFKSAEAINTQRLAAAAEESVTAFPAESISSANSNLDVSEEGTTRAFRALVTLNVAGDVTNSMRTLPGRKSLVLISGGLPLGETALNSVVMGGAPVPIVETRAYLGNVNYLLKQLVDRASRAGVVINTLDIRGLQALRGVSRFTDPGNEAGSRLGGGTSMGGQGRLPNLGTFDNLALDTMSGHQGLQALADATGGVSVVNTNNFREGLDKILARSSYYLLAYTPSEAFDNKYHKLEIKVSRPGLRIYSREGYFATPDPTRGPQTREDSIVRAAMSPLAKREIDIAGRLQYRFLPENVAEVDINLLINANNLDLKEGPDGKYHSTFDVVGFVMNSMGKSQGGFSQTVTANLTPEDYKRALVAGLSYTAHAQLPPGSYQLRAVVREAESGRLGSMSQYLEVPDLNKKNLTASSLFLYAVKVDAAGAGGAPEPLTALRQLPRQQDLRYAAVIYFPKVSDGKVQLTSQVIVSQGDKVIFREEEQPVTGQVINGQVVKIGQLGLSKAQPGRYVLTLLIKEPGKKEKGVIRSVDFNLVK